MFNSCTCHLKLAPKFWNLPCVHVYLLKKYLIEIRLNIIYIRKKKDIKKNFYHFDWIHLNIHYIFGKVRNVCLQKCRVLVFFNLRKWAQCIYSCTYIFIGLFWALVTWSDVHTLENFGPRSVTCWTEIFLRNQRTNTK